MKKKRLVAILVIVMICSIAIVGYAVKGQFTLEKDQIFKIANVIRDNKSEDGAVVATANGLEIYEGEVKLYKELYRLDGSIEKDSYKDVIQRRGKLKVLYKMAEEQGVAISIDEAVKIAQTERDMAEDNLDSEGKAFMQEYIDALGLTEDQYWSEYYPKQVQLFYSIEKLKSNFVEEAVKEEKLPKLANEEKKIKEDIETRKLHKKYADEKIKEIEDSITIEILNTEYELKTNIK